MHIPEVHRAAVFLGNTHCLIEIGMVTRLFALPCSRSLLLHAGNKESVDRGDLLLKEHTGVPRILTQKAISHLDSALPPFIA